MKRDFFYRWLRIERRFHGHSQSSRNNLPGQLYASHGSQCLHCWVLGARRPPFFDKAFVRKKRAKFWRCLRGVISSGGGQSPPRLINDSKGLLWNPRFYLKLLMGRLCCGNQADYSTGWPMPPTGLGLLGSCNTGSSWLAFNKRVKSADLRSRKQRSRIG